MIKIEVELVLGQGHNHLAAAGGMRSLSESVYDVPTLPRGGSDRLCTKVVLDLFAQRVAPEEHDVYSLEFQLNSALQRSAMCFDMFSYMPLLTERNH